MATTLEELVIELGVDNKNLIAQLKASSMATDKAMAAMQASVEGFAKEGSKQTSFFQQTMATMAGFIGGQAVLGAFQALKAATLDFATSMVKDGVSAAIAQEDALNELNTALALTGKGSASTSKDLEDFASQMQATTRFEDDAILTSMALIQTLGNLDKDGLKRATLAAANLASVLNIDLSTATTLVAKAAAGNTEAFSRYGIAIEKGDTAAQSFSNTILALDKFSGAAEARTRTFGGAVAQQANLWNDLQESVGDVIVKNLAVINVIKAFSGETANVTDGVKGMQDSLKEMVGQGLVIFGEAAILSVEILSGMEQSVRGVGFAFEAVGKTIGATGAALAAFLTGDFSGAKDIFMQLGEEVKTSFLKVGDSSETLDAVKASFERLTEAAALGLAEMGAGLEINVGQANVFNETMKAISEEEKARAQEGRDLAMQLIVNMEDDNELKLAIIAGQIEAEAALLDAAREQNLISQGEYELALQAQREKRAADEKKKSEDRLKRDADENARKLQAASIFFGGFAALAREGGQQTFGIAKRLSQAQAVVDGYAAIQRALANPPGPPFNLAIVAGITAQTIANVSKIQSQQFATGGTVPGIGFSDTVPGMLTPGEEVVNKSTSNILRDFLDEWKASGGMVGGGSSGATVIELRLKDGLMDFVETGLIERGRTNTSLQVS